MDDNFGNQEDKRLVRQFKKMIKEGNSQFFDSDDMEIIIEELISEFEIELCKKAIKHAMQLYPNHIIFPLLRVRMLMHALEIPDAEKEMAYIEKKYSLTSEYYKEKYQMENVINPDKNHCSTLMKAYELNSSDPEIYFLLSIEYVKQKRYAKALKYCITALHEEPFLSVQIPLFHNYIQEPDDSQAAIRFFKPLTEQFPLMKEMWIALGVAYGEKAMFEQAIDAFQFANSLDEDDAHPYFCLATTCFEMKNYEKALYYYQEWLGFDPNNYEAITCVGNCYLNMNYLESALSFYHKALSIFPGFSDAVLGIISIYEQKGILNQLDPDILKNAVSMIPGNFDLLFTVLAFFPEDKRSEKLEELFEISLLPLEDTLCHFRYYVEYCCNNDLFVDGIRIVEKYIDHADLGNYANYFLAALYFLSGFESMGGELLQKALLFDFEQYTNFLDIDPRLKDNITINHLIALYQPI